MQHPADEIVFRNFRPGDETAFLRLNEDWISKNFALEPHDREVLGDPRTHILDPGGQICIAEKSGLPIGCCALVPIASGEFELAKMTVSEAARGRAIGRRLLEFTIAEARRMGARRIYLESNTKAAAAVHLYEQLGFHHLTAPPQPSPYARANVFMKMYL